MINLSDSANWNYPTNIRFGGGRIAELPAICAELAINRPLLVTDSTLKAFDWLSSIENDLASHQIAAASYSNFSGNPQVADVANGISAFRNHAADAVIAIGGGSALDVGKAIALAAQQSRPLLDFEDVGDNWQRVDAHLIVPCIAIPTTSGTGSEVGRASVIVDPDSQSKKIIFHPKMMPDVVLADPALTVGLPPHLTAATGMDALSHNMEAWFAPGFHPLADGVAISGMKLVAQHLRQAVAEGGNLQARSAMMAASICGATAFQKGLGGMHALAHPIGATTGAHHGLLNAILMPYVLTANRPMIDARAADLAAALGVGHSFESLLDWVLQLRTVIGIPHSFSDSGITNINAAAIGEAAILDAAAAGNPRPLSATDYESICQAAIVGKMELIH